MQDALESLEGILELAKKLPVDGSYFSILQYSYELGKSPRNPELTKKQDLMFSKLSLMSHSKIALPNDKCVFWLLVQKAFEVGAVEKAKQDKKKYPYAQYFDNVRFYHRVENECNKRLSAGGEGLQS